MAEAVVNTRENSTSLLTVLEPGDNNICHNSNAAAVDKAMSSTKFSWVNLWQRNKHLALVTRIYAYQNRRPSTPSMEILDGAASSSDLVYLSLINRQSPFDHPSHAVRPGSPIDSLCLRIRYHDL